MILCSLTGNFLDDEAAKHLSEGLKANETLTQLRYAAPRHFPTISTR